jgi:hypothetical protein
MPPLRKMKQLHLTILMIMMAGAAYPQHTVTIQFSRNGREISRIGLFAYFEKDGAAALVRLPFADNQITLPHAALPDSHMVFLVKARGHYYPYSFESIKITQNMRWEFQWLTGKHVRRLAAEGHEPNPDCHAASKISFHPQERGCGTACITCHTSSYRALQRTKQAVHRFHHLRRE